MSNTEFAWELLLHTDAPAGCVLKAALFTTYDRPDERLLVEHLLPLLLKLSREPDGAGVERQFFLLELDRRLKQLHDKIVVISSTVREEAVDADTENGGTYGWIWRSIRHLTVGSQRKAVQHAKLWLLHWGAADGDGQEQLEIVVSSSNLTMSAFKGQLQAGWRACLPLHSQRSEPRLRGWGMLPNFLAELANSAGDGDRLAGFAELLARADCPDGVSFVACVPGTHSRQVLRRTPWGSAGLGAVAPAGRGTVGVSILSPYVGSWRADGLRRWTAAFDGAPDRIDLVWIDKHHPWARLGRWLLPKATHSALVEAGATLRQFRHESDDPDGSDRFHDDHRHTDDRWSHAKVYGLRRGNSRRLLVTSANFSTAAWGSEGPNGDLTIENFELGVCLDGYAWPFEDLDAFDNPEDAATVSQQPSRGSAAITWAQADWDGKHVKIDCRCESAASLEGEIRSGKEWTPIAKWNVQADGRLRSAKVSWRDAETTPSTVRLTCGAETVCVDVFDLRPSPEREQSVPPEVDADLAEEMRDALLFEQYEGRAAPDFDDGKSDDESSAVSDDVDENTGDDSEDVTSEDAAAVGGELEEPGGAVGRNDSYAVPAFVLARRYLTVVDNWADRVGRVAGKTAAAFEREWLRRDGELLVDAFGRQAKRDEKAGPARAIGARLAAEELSLRLKHFPEG